MLSQCVREARMASATFIQHQGRKLFHIDFKGSDVPTAKRVIADAASAIRAQPPHSAYVLTDITDAHWDDDVKEALKALAKGNAPYVKASAIVGVTGIRSIIFSAIARFSGREFKLFDTVDAAKDWLAKS
jgi:hypothetical protein